MQRQKSNSRSVFFVVPTAILPPLPLKKKKRLITSQYLFAADERVSFLATETEELWLVFLLPVLPLVIQDIERLGWPRKKNIEEHKVLLLYPKIRLKNQKLSDVDLVSHSSSPSIQGNHQVGNHPVTHINESLNLGSWRQETWDIKAIICSDRVSFFTAVLPSNTLIQWHATSISSCDPQGELQLTSSLWKLQHLWGRPDYFNSVVQNHHSSDNTI